MIKTCIICHSAFEAFTRRATCSDGCRRAAAQQYRRKQYLENRHSEISSASARQKKYPAQHREAVRRYDERKRIARTLKRRVEEAPRCCVQCSRSIDGLYWAATTCSPDCKAAFRKEYRRKWRGQNIQRERERLRDYERRRNRYRNPEAAEARRQYMRERYQRLTVADKLVREIKAKGMEALL